MYANGRGSDVTIVASAITFGAAGGDVVMTS